MTALALVPLFTFLLLLICARLGWIEDQPGGQ